MDIEDQEDRKQRLKKLITQVEKGQLNPTPVEDAQNSQIDSSSDQEQEDVDVNGGLLGP